MQCINRVAERLEESVGATPAQVSKAIKTKFVSMVEQHYLIRVKPPTPESTLDPHREREAGEGGGGGGGVFGKFELPSTLSGIVF